ncbi:hypothetical protein SpCBS45565_g07495 [Spizellomyces sp. 'palustris']|nr:hypothetical protein SpCBS45565_g07495 [Spizellomyces sp. 'palustris']
MTSEGSGHVELKLNRLIDQALKYIEQLQKWDSSSAVSPEQFDEPWFKNELVKGAKVLSHNATKLSLTAPHQAKDTPEICANIEKCILHIVAVVESVPPSLGVSLQDEIRSTSISLLFDVAHLANNLLSKPRSLESSNKLGYLSSTGIVWKACQVVENMSINNEAAVAKKVNGRTTLVADAVLELEEMLEAGGMADGGWDDLMSDDERETEPKQISDTEKDLVKRCIVIVKATKLMMKKTMTTLEKDGKKVSSQMVNLGKEGRVQVDVERVQMLDELARLSNICSQRVDDLVSNIDPPILPAEVASAASMLTSTCTDWITLAKTLFDEQATVMWFSTCGAQLQNVLEQILEKSSAR